MRTLLAYALLVVVVASVAVQAQAPAGGEFRVNNATAAGDIRPDIAADASGAFVVSWTDGSAHALVGARRYDSRGVPRGNAFTVGSTATFFSTQVIATDDRGRTMVVWERFENGVIGIWGRVFNASGAPLGSEFSISDPSIFAQYPAVAAARGGNFVVAWTDIGQEVDVVARRFGAAGNPVGSQFTVNSFTTGIHAWPSLATDDTGGFVVAWTGGDAYTNDVFGRRFDAAGQALGAQFQLNGTTAGFQEHPQVTAGDRGAFVVVWLDRQVPAVTTIVGRRFDAGGVPAGAEFVVGAPPPGFYIYVPSVASDRAGNFTVAWELSDGDSNGVFARRFTATGLPRGAQFRINTTTTSDQAEPRIADDGSGNLFAAWQSGQIGLMPEIYGQRFGGLVPAGLAVADGGGGNGVLEAGDSFTLRPSWRNVSGAPQSFQGRASEPQMPSGLVLALSTDADYGTVADGAVGTCTSLCFTGSLTGTRPAGHVDGSFLETIVPDVQGQARRRLLHVGGSFSDVPRTSPFYRFVETMLHQGISGGCGAGLFCPTSTTPREQIAVMGLLGKEGAGYQPPACGVTPRFLDVPVTSPFCRWIEELARRGVVGGCGGGNYCPSAPVTREQLCVIILRLLDPAYTPPACATPLFGDVPATSPFCPWIEEMARRGVAGGCGNGNFCPTLPVTREQVSVFVTVAFGLILYGP